MTCPRDDLPELVLGTLDGARRAAVVGHLATCEACREEVEGLTRVTDALLLALPEAEPPAGFESRVARAFGRRRVWPRRLLAAAAAVLLLVAGLAIGGRRHDVASASGPMRDGARHEVGYAVVSGGAHPFVYVSVDHWGESGDYVVEVIDRDGVHTPVTSVRIASGRGAAGGPLPVAFGDVRAVWVTDAAHTEWCAFRL